MTGIRNCVHSSPARRDLCPRLSGLCSLLIVLMSGVLVADEPSAETRESRLRQQVAQLLETLEGSDWIPLIMADLELSTDLTEESQSCCRRILQALAVADDAAAQEHVHAVFENEPERRGMAAEAVAMAAMTRPGSLRNWRLLVRSLNVVRQSEAAAVLKALQRYRQRANKGHWVRRVILTGLSLPEGDQRLACELLQHWTGQPIRPSAAWSLPQYQEWFAKEHPDLPPAVRPQDPPGAVWTMQSLESLFSGLHLTSEQGVQGPMIFEKAGCAKCHRRGDPGGTAGPDLTSLGWRRQRAEVLESLLYPSQELHEEYPTVIVVLKDGTALTGLLQRAPDAGLQVFSSAGEVRTFQQSDVEAIRGHAVSSMPAGTLDRLTADEVRTLVAWLTSVDGIPRPHQEDEGQEEE
jgi:putative heme-binding domain-containing protein